MDPVKERAKRSKTTKTVVGQQAHRVGFQPPRPRAVVPPVALKTQGGGPMQHYITADSAFWSSSASSDSPRGREWRRFRMRRPVFLRILEALAVWSPFFTRRDDALSQAGLSPIQRCTAAIRQLAYGSPEGQLDEYMKISKSTAVECLKKFVQGVIEVFGPEYLIDKDKLFAEKQEDVERVLGILQSRWSILHQPARIYDQGDLEDIMLACIILHNMIIEDKKDIEENPIDLNDEASTFVIHRQLHRDLVEHLTME